MGARSVVARSKRREEAQRNGSAARGDAKRGSDIDLMATFGANPGLRFFTMEDEISAILGVPVHLLTRESVEQMSNPYRRASILADARETYRA